LITLTILSLYVINPVESNPLHAAIFPSYPQPAKIGSSPDTPTQYGKGPKDFALVAFYTIVLSFLRDFIMQQVVRPFAISCGIRTKGKQARFLEQAYSAIYFGISGAFGLYVMWRSPVWYFDTTAMYEGFPHKTHEGLFKLYYLLQASYWAQQALVLILQLEKPHKDFKVLVAHHATTLSLIWLSYRFHFTYMGLAVFVTHDISDFFFSVCCATNLKMLILSDVKNTWLSQLRLRHALLQPLRLFLDISTPLFESEDFVGGLD
jgi:acyl-CoA-dependent ceramide synthase